MPIRNLRWRPENILSHCAFEMVKLFFGEAIQKFAVKKLKSMREVHITVLPKSPCLTEFYEIWHTRSSHWWNQLCQIFSLGGYGVLAPPKTAISHWLAVSPYSSLCITVLHCDRKGIHPAKKSCNSNSQFFLGSPMRCGITGCILCRKYLVTTRRKSSIISMNSTAEMPPKMQCHNIQTYRLFELKILAVII